MEQEKLIETYEQRIKDLEAIISGKKMVIEALQMAGLNRDQKLKVIEEELETYRLANCFAIKMINKIKDSINIPDEETNAVLASIKLAEGYIRGCHLELGDRFLDEDPRLAKAKYNLMIEAMRGAIISIKLSLVIPKQLEEIVKAIDFTDVDG